jgi:O-antigen ligase
MRPRYPRPSGEGGPRGHRAASASAPSQAEARRTGLIATAVLTGTLTLEYGLFGGNRTDLALGFAIANGLILLGVASTSWGAARLQAIPGLGVSAALFGVVLAALIFSLLPLSLDHRGGRIVGASGASLTPILTAVEIVKLLGYACAYLTAALLTQDRRGSALFLRALLISAIAFALLCLIAEGVSSRSVGGWTKPMIAQGRVSGLFSSPNTAATVFAMNVLLASGALVRAVSELQRRRFRIQIAEMLAEHNVEIIAFALNFQCLILSSSRGGIGVFVLTLFGLAAWLGWRSKRRLLGFAVLGGLLLPVALINGGLAMHRYATAAYAGDDRLLWFRTAWGAFLSAPLQGYGLGSLPMVFRSAAQPDTFRALNWAGSAHDVFLQWLLEGGLLAAIPMFALIGWTLYRAGARAPEEGAGSVLRPTLVACLLLVLVHSCLEYSLQEPAIATLFTIILGGAAGLAGRPGRSRRGGTAPLRP